MEAFISFAEYMEDLIIWHALGQKKSGFYIDVGAYDPYDLSVTKSFSMNGWRGINIEPLKNRYEELLADRPNDINLNVAISKEEKWVMLHEAGGGSTLEEQVLKSVRRNNALTGSSKIWATTLDKVIEQFIGNQDTIDFIKIDVEGHEKEVLMSINLEISRPRIFVVESVVPWKGTAAYHSWEEILLTNGYKLGLDFRNNRYYFDSLKAELDFIKPMQLYKKYKIIMTCSPNDKYRWTYMAIESLLSEYPILRRLSLAVVRLLYPIVGRFFPHLVR